MFMSTYNKYCAHKHARTMEEKVALTNEVSANARNFVWSLEKLDGLMQYPKGKHGDCLEVLTFIMGKCSESFVDPNSEMQPVIEVGLEMRTSFSAERTFASHQSLDDEFSAVFKYEHVVREKKRACRFEGCTGTATCQNTVSLQDFPPFLLLGNAREAGIALETTNFPSILQISEKLNYEIKGRVYSSSYDGSHFYTVCYKTIGCIPYPTSKKSETS
ncbi:uncharacterized protein EV154DRAFT_479538 [Mucor mucedo]|uniref:uncharacterized protein n=1 Tax=Mucor mucedo TaxID=29922 RepID=UPI00221F6D18|nr:uncharacterized protein EV154DRAFT_479538 [Mucor mucedo]KAI7893314.1 hypothetical protein EV154DRAFT_479538 [Mucor mucedo]